MVDRNSDCCSPRKTCAEHDPSGRDLQLILWYAEHVGAGLAQQEEKSIMGYEPRAALLARTADLHDQAAARINNSTRVALTNGNEAQALELQERARRAQHRGRQARQRAHAPALRAQNQKADYPPALSPPRERCLVPVLGQYYDIQGATWSVGAAVREPPTEPRTSPAAASSWADCATRWPTSRQVPCSPRTSSAVLRDDGEHRHSGSKPRGTAGCRGCGTADRTSVFTESASVLCFVFITLGLTGLKTRSRWATLRPGIKEPIMGCTVLVGEDEPMLRLIVAGAASSEISG